MKYLEVLNYGSKVLKLKNINSYNLDCELILAKVLNSSREEILTNLNKKIAKINIIKFKKLLDKRKNNEPIAYIFKQINIVILIAEQQHWKPSKIYWFYPTRMLNVFVKANRHPDIA